MTIEKTLSAANEKITESLANYLHAGTENLGKNFDISTARKLIGYLVDSFHLSFSTKDSYFPKELKPTLRDKGIIYRIHDFSDDPIESPQYKRKYSKSGITYVSYGYPVSDVKSTVILIGDPIKPRDPLFVCLPGIKIDPKANENYTENELVIRLCVQNVFNCFGLINPQFHTFQETYRIQFSQDYSHPQKILYGNAIRRFQLHLAWLFARKMAPEFGIKEQEAREMMVDSLSEWSVFGAHNKDISNYVENIERILGSKNVGDVILNPWPALREYYDYDGEVDSLKRNVDRFSLRLMELWKRNKTGEWKKVS